MCYLFGNILTHYGSGSLNHGQNEGNMSYIQKVLWRGEVHSTVSAYAIRWSIRHYWQRHNYEVNRRWIEDKMIHQLQDENYDPVRFIDDDVLGYMTTDAAKAEEENEEELTSKKKGNKKKKGTSIKRQGPLGVNRAISLRPYDGTMMFYAKSGEKSSTSLFGSDLHNTQYQYCFGLDCSTVYGMLLSLVGQMDSFYPIESNKLYLILNLLIDLEFYI